MYYNVLFECVKEQIISDTSHFKEFLTFIHSILYVECYLKCIYIRTKLANYIQNTLETKTTTNDEDVKCLVLCKSTYVSGKNTQTKCAF